MMGTTYKDKRSLSDTWAMLSQGSEEELFAGSNETPRSSVVDDDAISVVPGDDDDDESMDSQEARLSPGSADLDETELNDDLDPNAGPEAVTDNGRHLYHSTRSLVSIMDDHLLSSIRLKRGVVRDETEAFQPHGPRTFPSIRRKEFAAYLRHTGFHRHVASIILKLYQAKDLPAEEDAVHFIATAMGYSLTPRAQSTEKSRLDIKRFEELTARVVKVQQEIDALRRKLDDYEDSETVIEIVQPQNLPPFKLQRGVPVAHADGKRC